MSSITRTSSSERFLRSSESLLNLLNREDVEGAGDGFYSKYEPKEVLGRCGY